MKTKIRKYIYLKNNENLTQRYDIIRYQKNFLQILFKNFFLRNIPLL